MPGTKTAEELFQEFENIVTSKEDTKQRATRFFNENALGIIEVIHNNETLLDVAIRRKCHSLIIEQLLNYPVDVHAKDSVHIAVKNNNIKVVNALLENSQSVKLNINEKDKKGSTALDCAKPGSQMYALLESHGAAHSEEYQHLTALGIKVEDFDEEKLKTDVMYCFGILEKALNIEDSKHREEVVAWLVKDKKANVDCKKSNGKTLLEGSIQNSNGKNKLEKLELLLKLGAKTIDNTTSWEYICNYSYSYSSVIKLVTKYSKYPEINKLLPGLAKISDVNLLKELLADNQYVVKSRDSNGDTLLSLAIKNNSDDKVLKELLKSGADPYSINNDRLTALGLLAQNNGSNLEQAKILVEAMEKVARRDASKRSELKSIIETKSNGSQIESKTLLERALVDGKDDIAGLLIITGARKGINIKDDQGKDIFDRSFNNNSISEFWHGDVFINPLIDRAIGEKDLFIIKKLLKHERTKNLIIEKVRDNDDLVTKTIKDKSNSNNQFLEFLINNDLLSANAKIHGKPLLQLACEADNLSAAKLLIGLGADISTKIEHGYTSLDYVLEKEKEEFFKLFIDTIESYEKSKKVELLSSAMLHAVQNQKKAVFNKWSKLLQYGASVTYQNSDGDNLMHIAQKADRVDCVLDKLLQHQLPNATREDLVLALSTKNNEGKTPIDGINNKPQLAPYKNYFEEYVGRKSREIFYKGIGATAFTTLLVGAFAFLPFVELPVALYVAAAVASIGIACTAYKVYSVGNSINAETRDVQKNIDSRLSKLSTSEHLNGQASSPQAA